MSFFKADHSLKGLCHINSPYDLLLCFLDSIYFSVITFTTVGYGDLTPQGFGKLVSILLAISGVSVIALFISKISSERQLSTLILLHTSDLERRIGSFSHSIDNQCILLLKLKTDFLNHSNSDLGEFNKALYDLNEMLHGTFRFLKYHSKQSVLDDFTSGSPLKKLVRTLKECHEIIHELRNVASFHTETEDMLLNISTNLCKVETFDVFVKTHGGTSYFSVLHDKLVYWSNTDIKESLLKKVVALVPDRSTKKWTINVSDDVSKKLGISKKKFSKCINVLKKRNIIT